MPTQITVDKTTRFAIPRLSAAQLTQVGGVIVERLNKRVAAFRNLNDQPAKPYSTNGPIYVPVSGVGTIFKGLGGLNKGIKIQKKNLTPDQIAIFTEKRTKSSLGGREVFTKKDVAKLKKSGVIGSAPTALGQVTPSGYSVKFKDYAAYKRALGKSGNRDLELSGRMMGSLGIVAQSASSITIGFTRHEEELKAEGNQARDPWFGLNAQDQKYLEELIAGWLK